MIVKPVAIAGTWGNRKARAPADTVHTPSGHRRLSRIRAGCCSGSAGLVRAAASRLAIGDDTVARRPNHMPSSPAASHHSAAKNTSG